jgi:hypothetical protein
VTRIGNDPNVHVRANYSYLGFAARPGQTQYTTLGTNVVVGAGFTYTNFDYVVAPRTRIIIDPNIRVRGNDTYAGFEDVNGPIAVGEVVDVHEPESGLTGQGRVTEIDADRQIVYLSVNWSSLKEEEPQSEPTAPQGALLYLTTSPSTNEDDWMGLVTTPSLAQVGFSNSTLCVTAPAQGWSTGTVTTSTGPISTRISSPYLEVPSLLEILQAYAG